VIEKKISEPEIEWENISPLEKASFDNDPVRWLKALQKKEQALQEDKIAIQKEKTAIQKKEQALQEEKTAIQKKEQALQEEKTAIQKQEVLKLELQVKESKNLEQTASVPKRLDVLKLLDASSVIGDMEAEIEKTKRFWQSASFSQKCLESRLDRRNSTYCPDNEDNVKILLGVSGAGKTRQLLELLYINHGYYFVAPKVNGFGSIDLLLCQKRCEENPDYCNYFIEVLYFVRAVVCSYLMNNGFNKPSQILLAQIHPETFFGSDMFATLFDSYAAKISNVQLRYIRPYFNFVVMDEIQHLVESATVFQMSQELRPFLSPLILHSKNMGIFPKFILSGTGINFEFIQNLLGSQSLKDLNIHYKVLSTLEPLDKLRVVNYSRLILQDNDVESDLTKEFIQSVESFELCHGWARFIASILDRFLETRDIENALDTFLEHLTNIDNQLFPLKFHRRDLLIRKGIYYRIGLGRQWEQQISECILNFINTGRARLSVSEQEAADAVSNGLGFCQVSKGHISSVEIVEVAIIYCLRSFLPFTSLARKIIAQMETFPTPHMVGFMLEYLVGYALVSNLNPQVKENMKVFSTTNEVNYLSHGSENEIFFPVQRCGPDILYRCGRCVHIVQVKFVDTFYMQKRLHACRTTNPKFFYWNSITNRPLKYFNQQRLNLLEALTKFEVKRYVIYHTNTKTTEGMDTIIVNKDTSPDFFDNVFPGAWNVLGNLREHFNKLYSL
jgi:hypothetical protein